MHHTPTCFMGVFNTKYGGGGFNLCPYSVVNDGMIEILVLTGKANFGVMVSLMDDASKYQGIHGYKDNIRIFRGKNIKVVNTNPVNKNGAKDAQIYAIDGEDLLFREFVKYETLPGWLEVIVDYDFLMQDKQ